MTVNENSWDLFVSYSSADDELPQPYDRRVSAFVGALKQSLKAILPRRPRVYFDQESARANHDWERIFEACRNSRLFLAISSPAFDAGEWPRNELDTFVTACSDPDRLFVAKFWPTDASDTSPAVLHKRTYLKFYRGDEASPNPLLPGSEEFTNQVLRLATMIRDQLNAMGGESRSEPPPAPKLGPVLLAMTSDDLDDQRAAVRSYLEMVDIEVLPAEEYSLGGDVFRQAYAADLARSKLMVQLLGPRPGRRPRDLPEGYVRYQADAAVAAGVPVMQWRSLELDPAEVADEAHRQLLLRETVVASTLEQFKREVRSRAQAPPAAVETGANPHFLVFVNAEKSDEPVARRMKEELEREYSVMLPLYDAEGSIQDDFRENLERCDALLLVYGDAGPSWVRNQMMFVAKTLRGMTPRGAICLGPPPEKPHVNFSVPGLRELDCRTDDGAGWRFDQVRDLVAGLQ